MTDLTQNKLVINPLDQKEKKTDIISLRELFSGNHVFRVPDYQRGYAWFEEFEVMWRDIIHLYRTGNHKHYTGMLALEEISDASVLENEAIVGTTAFYIVDGQQRLTSLTIILNSLLAYVREELPDADMYSYSDLLVTNDIYRFGYSYKRQDGAADFFEERIFKNNTGLVHGDKYLSNINSAREYIDRELNKLSGETAKEILELVLNRVVFNLYFVTEDFDVRVTFETINNRGKRLSKLELLKNRLMYLSTFFPPTDSHGLQLKNNINKVWKTIYTNLCYGDEQLSDDDYLRAHWVVYGRLDKSNGTAYINDLLSNQFAIDSGTFFDYIKEKEYGKAYSHVNDYINSLSKFSLYWAFVNMPDSVTINVSSEEKSWICRLSRISNTLYLRAALMVIVAENDIALVEKINLYSKMELFVFTNKLLAQDRNDLSFFVTSAKRLLNEEVNKAVALKRFAEDIDRHELKVDSSRIITAVEAFKLNVLDKKNYYFYDWNGLSYFLYEYNESLKIPNAAEIEWYKLSNTSIEHVLPQTPSNEYWSSVVAKYNEDEIRRITNSLGNLLLLSAGSENSSLKNYSFPVKKEMSIESRKFAYCDGSRSAREIATEDYWTINQVVERNNRLVQFMYDHWFSNVQGFSKDAWDSISIQLKNDIPDRLNEMEYSILTEKLDTVDTSDERKEASNSVSAKEENYFEKQFKEYIDTEIIPIKYNKNKIYYKDWFTFKILSDDNVPNRLACGVLINDISYRVRYFYETNTLKINYWKDDAEIYISDVNEVPEKLQVFLHSLERYLRKSFGKDKPQVITE